MSDEPVIVIATRRKRWFAALALIAIALLAMRSGGSFDPATASSDAPSEASTDHVAPTSRPTRAPVLAPITPGALRLEGQAVDSDDHPVGGAKITLAGARTTITESDGSFAFDDLAAGKYAVIAEKDLMYGEDQAVELGVATDPVTIKLVAGPTIAVRVVEPSGKPIGGAKVGTSARSAITDDRGAARLRGVDFGYELVAVSASGHESIAERVVTGDDPAVTIERTIVLGSGAALTGTVVDEAGKPVGGAVVEIEAANGKRSETLFCDDAGAWQIADLGAGKYLARAGSTIHLATADVAVEVDGVHATSGVVLRVVVGGVISGIVVDASGAPVAEASVQVGTTVDTTTAAGRFSVHGLAADTYDVSAATKTSGMPSVQIKLDRGGHADVQLVIRSSSIAGIVIDSRGAPIEDAVVSAHTGDPHGWASATSDARGRFDLGGLPPGDYEVSAHRTDQTSTKDGATLHVTAGQRDVRIVLPELSAIVGRVLLDGVPVPYYGVAITETVDTIAFERPHSIRDPNGAFSERGLTPGSWNVIVVGPGFARRVIENVNVAAGATADLGDIAVDRGASVRGRVVDGDGLAVAGALVQISSGWSTRDDRLRSLLGDNFTATTDADGDYEIDGMTPSDDARRITATHPTLGSSAFRALGPTETEVDLVISPTGAIDGTIAGTATRLRWVVAKLVGETSASYDADLESTGEFHFGALPPGDYEVSVRSRSMLPPQRVTVVANGHAIVTFEVPRQPVTLIVQSPTCNYASLETPGSNTSFAFEACAEGRATFAGIAPGDYEVCISGECTPIAVPAQPEYVVSVP